MMSSLVKEMLHDLVARRLSIDDRITLYCAIDSLLKAGTVKASDIKLLDLYLCGFSVEEIAIKSFLSTQTTNDILARVVVAIEYASGFLDEIFLNKLSGKYTQNQIKRAREYLIKQSKDFSYENI